MKYFLFSHCFWWYHLEFPYFFFFMTPNLNILYVKILLRINFGSVYCLVGVHTALVIWHNFRSIYSKWMPWCALFCHVFLHEVKPNGLNKSSGVHPAPASQQLARFWISAICPAHAQHFLWPRNFNTNNLCALPTGNMVLISKLWNDGLPHKMVKSMKITF